MRYLDDVSGIRTYTIRSRIRQCPHGQIRDQRSVHNQNHSREGWMFYRFPVPKDKLNSIMCAVMTTRYKPPWKKKFDAYILIMDGRHRKNKILYSAIAQSVKRQGFLLLFFFFINKTSMIQAKSSAHIVHIHRKAAADWVGGCCK
jgi:hypothetical protein